MPTPGFSLLFSLLLGVAWLMAGDGGALPPQSVAAIAVPSAAAAPLLERSAPEPPLQRVARKGTRNYVPGEDVLSVPSTVTTGTTDDTSGVRDPLEECLEIWDPATHITKSKWREICERQIRERAEARREFEAKFPAQQ